MAPDIIKSLSRDSSPNLPTHPPQHRRNDSSDSWQLRFQICQSNRHGPRPLPFAKPRQVQSGDYMSSLSPPSVLFPYLFSIHTNIQGGLKSSNIGAVHSLEHSKLSQKVEAIGQASQLASLRDPSAQEPYRLPDVRNFEQNFLDP